MPTTLTASTRTTPDAPTWMDANVHKRYAQQNVPLDKKTKRYREVINSWVHKQLNSLNSTVRACVSRMRLAHALVHASIWLVHLDQFLLTGHAFITHKVSNIKQRLIEQMFQWLGTQHRNKITVITKVTEIQIDHDFGPKRSYIPWTKQTPVPRVCPATPLSLRIISTNACACLSEIGPP